MPKAFQLSFYAVQPGSGQEILPLVQEGLDFIRGSDGFQGARVFATADGDFVMRMVEWADAANVTASLPDKASADYTAHQERLSEVATTQSHLCMEVPLKGK